jgi:hypothetical protein
MRVLKRQANSKQCVILSEKPTHKLCSFKQCEKGYWIFPRFGQISELLTENLGVVQWIASLQESHVNRTLWLAKDVERKMTETFGPICRELLGKWSQESLWWKTCQVSLLDRNHTDFKSWENSNTWVIASQGLLYRLKKLGLPIDEIEDLSSGLWPTPNCADAFTGNLKSTQQKEGSKHSLTLSRAVFKTPSVMDAVDIPLRKDATATRSITLAQQMTKFPTPRAQDSKGCGRPGSKSHDHMLEKKYLCAVVHYPTPRASDSTGGYVTTEKTQKGYRSINKSGLEKGAKLQDAMRLESGKPHGKLNPQFVEWLMGVQIGRTELRLEGTRSCHKLLKELQKKYSR